MLCPAWRGIGKRMSIQSLTKLGWESVLNGGRRPGLGEGLTHYVMGATVVTMHMPSVARQAGSAGVRPCVSYHCFPLVVVAPLFLFSYVPQTFCRWKGPDAQTTIMHAEYTEALKKSGSNTHVNGVKPNLVRACKDPFEVRSVDLLPSQIHHELQVNNSFVRPVPTPESPRLSCLSRLKPETAALCCAGSAHRISLTDNQSYLTACPMSSLD
ncbi:hypothetical protein CC78DRAFT_581729 [Lojkania enalia]|uniref:Uncharacterized protein n=1 Tax=Lojkania enalia TaxID=147567 RepID=A0A9P4K7F3_9PLEO|nr:hypothetical protein CC78DRAFT_581729 [Didymosphaeria enalia]